MLPPQPATALPHPPLDDAVPRLHREELPVATAVEPAVLAKPKRPSTAHLKTVPETRERRDRIRDEAQRFGQTIDRSKPLTKQSLQQLAEELLRARARGER